ncbi:hypothetical protein [Streptomyces sp. BK022]|uniref:hypothetical protein n=1 Tax=Streptomyces sp. BK022 TaxID=2512123 RepID=UPI001029E6D4|nr:hypothetical protein [Streptomyces sp. BK022]
MTVVVAAPAGSTGSIDGIAGLRTGRDPGNALFGATSTTTADERRDDALYPTDMAPHTLIKSFK